MLYFLRDEFILYANIKTLNISLSPNSMSFEQYSIGMQKKASLLAA